MRRYLLLFALIQCCSMVMMAQKSPLDTRLDGVVNASTKKKFNGIIQINREGKAAYTRVMGYADRTKKTPLRLDDQFVIGSISKQFTAVLVLREYDGGRLDLTGPIRRYLPELTQTWADTVTVHHLLTHTHGIVALEKPTLFSPGTQFNYSQIGFDLLARIVAKTSGKSFARLSQDLFKTCHMTHTFHPDVRKYKRLVKGYSENSKGKITIDSASLDNYAAAGSFISTVEDLERWNQQLHGQKLLKSETYQTMLTIQHNAVRQHPVFGRTLYGYGITVDEKDGLLQVGQTGYAPGFVSMNFYFPGTKTSAIILSNVVYDAKDDLKKTFVHHTRVLEIVQQYLLGK